MSGVLDLIEEVRQFGVTLLAEPPDLVLIPAGVVPTELKAKLKRHKPDVLRRLHLEQSMRRLEAAGIRIAIWENGAMRILMTENDALTAVDCGGTVYSPTDMFCYVQLQPDERRMLHDFKKSFGGTTKWESR
jgi:hypothetical protein